jgi:hypothetical protein
MTDEDPAATRDGDDGAVRRLTGDDYAFERVAADDVVAGDRVLVYPGERIGVDGSVTEMLAGEGDRVDVEAADGTRRQAATDASVAAGDRVFGAPVVVTRGRGVVPPWWAGGVGLPATVRSLVALAVVVLALTATGFGLWNPVDQFVAGSDLVTDGSNPADEATLGPTEGETNDPDPTTSGTSSGDSGDESGETPPSGATDTPSDGDDQATIAASSDDGRTDGGSPDIDLRAGSDAGVTLFEAANVLPGETGTANGTLSNAGTDGGRLRLADVRYESDENGRNEAEATVDDTGGDPGPGAGELHEFVALRMAIERSGEPRRYVFGDADSYRPLTDLASDGAVDLGTLGAGETVDVVVEWHVDGAAGNEIQSDSIDVAVSFRLTSG